jgi:phosphomevalonate kinase
LKRFKVSAPSKVLLTGAYLIIEPDNEGIVLSTDARFYTTVVAEPGYSERFEITIESPQFKLNKTYSMSNQDGTLTLEARDDASLGPIDQTLVFALALLYRRLPDLKSLKVTLQGDNSFYSQRGSQYFPYRLRE